MINHLGSWHFPIYKYLCCFDFCSTSVYCINPHREEAVLFIYFLDVYSTSNTPEQSVVNDELRSDKINSANNLHPLLLRSKTHNASHWAPGMSCSYPDSKKCNFRLSLLLPGMNEAVPTDLMLRDLSKCFPLSQPQKDHTVNLRINWVAHHLKCQSPVIHQYHL